MPRKLKEGQNRKVSVTLSVDPKKWDELQKRCEEMQAWLKSKGVDEKNASSFSRSELVRQMVDLGSKPQYIEFLKVAIGSAFGVNSDQLDIFGED